MRLKSIFFSLLLTGSLFFSQSANAHEFLLKPSNAHPDKNELVKVQAQAAHVFMQSEEAEPLADVELFLRQKAKDTPVVLKENPKNLCLEGSFSLSEAGAALLVGHRKAQVWSQTTEGVLEGGRKELEAKGKTVISVDKYEKFTKTLLNSHLSEPSFNQAIGQELEIIPVGDVSKLKVGDELECQLLYKGKALIAPIWATYDGFSSESNTYAYYTESPKETFKVKISAKGLWLVRAEHNVKGKNAELQNHIMRTTLVFEVR